MKILHVVQSLDPEWGGIARVLPSLAGKLAAAGETCRIATLHGDRFGSAPEVQGVEVLRFEAKPNSQLGTSKAFNAQIDGLIAETDVLHIHGLWAGQNWSACKAARKRGVPHIITPHSHMMPWAWKRSWWKKRPAGWLFEHKNLRTAACLQALAEGEAKHIRDLGFNDRVEVIPNGLDVSAFDSLPSADGLIERFGELKDKRWLLMLGRIHPQKGIVHAMQACFDILASGEDWHLVIAGPDEVGMRSMLEAAIARKGGQGRVTFTGMLDRQDVLACLGRASLLLQASKSEGLSMSILEAMAAGLPVLISEACNLPEVASCGAGGIVPPARGEIARALKKLVAAGDDAMKAMGQKGRQLASERFDWSVLVPKYQAMYQMAAAT